MRNHPIPRSMRTPTPISIASIVPFPVEEVVLDCSVGVVTDVLVVVEVVVEIWSDPFGSGVGGSGVVGALVGGATFG